MAHHPRAQEALASHHPELLHSWLCDHRLDQVVLRRLDAASFPPFSIAPRPRSIASSAQGISADSPSQLSGLRRLLASRKHVLAAHHLLHEHALREIVTALHAQGLEHVVFKGQHLAHALYESPLERCGTDIDILVAGDTLAAACMALQELGYAHERDTQSSGKALTLTKGHVHIDLHWSICREGRLRHNPTQALIQTRTTRAGMPVCESPLAFVVLAAHTAFSEHLVLRLVRLLDLVLWMETLAPSPEAVIREAHHLGAQTSVWATLDAASALFGYDPPRELCDALAPSRAKQLALRQWVQLNLSQRLPPHASAALTLLLQDSLRDTARATAHFIKTGTS